MIVPRMAPLLLGLAVAGLLSCPQPATAATPRVLASYLLASDLRQPGLPALPRQGPAIAAVGDLDGNGTVDLAAGAAGDLEDGPERGAVVILFMDDSGAVASTRRISSVTPGLAGLLGDGDQFGTSLAAIGDVNRDGVPDLAVGAAGDDHGATDAGAIWILMLTTDGGVAGAHRITAAEAGPGVAAQYDGFGYSLSSIGDLDGNGTVDLAIGAVGSDRVHFNAGAVWVCLLRRNLTVKRIVRLGDDASGLDGVLAHRGAFGTTLNRIGDELFVGALGDGTGFAPPPVLWAVRLDDQGAATGYRKFLPVQEDTLLPRGDIDQFGDFDFDGNKDLVATTSEGLQILFLDEDGQIREFERATGENRHARVSCCETRSHLMVIPDIDGNVIPEIVTSNGFEVRLLSLNGDSAEGAACGDPSGDGVVTATDGLFVLRAAVGLRFCERLWCDVDSSGLVTAGDALIVLQRAVQSQDPLLCPTTTTTTTTTIIISDECFEDSDCYPERPICCFYDCCECWNSGDCAASEVCLGEACYPDTCRNGLADEDETDVDCGGGCPPCQEGEACEDNPDCFQRQCLSGVCQPASCSDEVRNNSETGTDCGGNACPACEPGHRCERGSDCSSRVCRWEQCHAPACDDSTRNGLETDRDCGGGECPPCDAGRACTLDDDCLSAVCLGGACQVPTCRDGVQNGTESGVDCGGEACAPCGG